MEKVTERAAVSHSLQVPDSSAGPDPSQSLPKYNSLGRIGNAVDKVVCLVESIVVGGHDLRRAVIAALGSLMSKCCGIVHVPIDAHKKHAPSILLID
jgi:hypothetical protein